MHAPAAQGHRLLQLHNSRASSDSASRDQHPIPTLRRAHPPSGETARFPHAVDTTRYSWMRVLINSASVTFSDGDLRQGAHTTSDRACEPLRWRPPTIRKRPRQWTSPVIPIRLDQGISDPTQPRFPHNTNPQGSTLPTCQTPTILRRCTKDFQRRAIAYSGLYTGILQTRYFFSASLRAHARRTIRSTTLRVLAVPLAHSSTHIPRLSKTAPSLAAFPFLPTEARQPCCDSQRVKPKSK